MTSSDQTVSPLRLSPESIRDETFQRRMRGLDAHQVYEYLDLLADQVQVTEGELDRARAENARLQAELQRVQAELDEYEQVGDRVNEQVVQLFSQAQLIAEEMVEDVSRDARERIAHAREHEREVVRGAMDTAGEQVRSYARSAQAQMQSIMESFAAEVDRLGSPAGPSHPPAAPRSTGDPLLDDLPEWRPPAQNGHGQPGVD
jgi:DivIVA domain-containing protein